ncbi:succinate dehydrogenase assembly factor 2 [Aliiglaciecola sp. CAU 1673]|uniref:FAD assembly factor SdhE n=1 Tax=Aliiglaciecola sp. CAU 1673 TaxID=3032595 RepID=UPI0023DA5046|nr:succinate dehydrogenase assembly factor 2 [Aliiglaciecola sp. CAU 1673]MDF2177990.1 succinate dehydrogenase assembly factor 2 [Aliiglaciecola sp. CAU 1673]
MFSEQRAKRIGWACRRGMLELDVLFRPFYEQQFLTLDDEDKETFERLLTCDDPDLYAWVMGHQACTDAKLAAMVDKIVNRGRV